MYVTYTVQSSNWSIHTKTSCPPPKHDMQPHSLPQPFSDLRNAHNEAWGVVGTKGDLSAASRTVVGPSTYIRVVMVSTDEGDEASSAIWSGKPDDYR